MNSPKLAIGGVTRRLVRLLGVLCLFSGPLIVGGVTPAEAADTYSISLPAGSGTTMQVPSQLNFTITNTNAPGGNVINKVYLEITANAYTNPSGVAPAGWTVTKAKVNGNGTVGVTFEVSDQTASCTGAIPPGGSAVFGVVVTGAAASTDVTADTLTTGTKIEQKNFCAGLANKTFTNPAFPTWPRKGVEASLSATPTSLGTGGTITVTMTVTNRSSQAYDAIAPSALTVSGSGSAALASGPTPASLTLAAGASGSITWTYTATGAGSVTFSGTASDPTPNPGISSLTAISNSVTIGSLTASLAVSPSAAVSGDDVTVTMTVQNNGTDPVNNVTPSALTFLGSASASLVSGPTPSSSGTLNPTEATFFSWTYNITGSAGQTYIFQGSASGDGGSLVSNTATSNTGTLVTHSATVSPDTVVVGSTNVTLSFTVTNQGGYPVNDVTIINSNPTEWVASNIVGFGCGGSAPGWGASGWSYTFKAGTPEKYQFKACNPGDEIPTGGGQKAFAVTFSTIPNPPSDTSYNFQLEIKDTNKGKDVVSVSVLVTRYTLTLSASPATLGADGQSTSTVTATLTRGGTPQSGKTISFTTTSGTLSSSSAVTNASGQATVTLTAPVSESDILATVTANYLSLVEATTTVTFQRVVLAVSAAPAAIDADGQSASTITVTLTQGGAALSGATVTLMATSGTLSAFTLTTNGSGQATSTLTAPVSASDIISTVTATYKGHVKTTSVNFLGITFTLTPSTATVDADGQSTVGLTLTFRYTTGGGAITGATATVSATSGSVSPASPASSASTIAVTYTAPASSSDSSATVTATYRGFTATSTITLRGITFTLTPATATVDADGQSTVSLTLRLRYTSGGAITGASTTVSLSGSGTLSPTGSVSSSASDITLTYTAPTSSADGTATVTAAAYKGFSAQSSTITYSGITFTLTPATATVDADGQSTVSLTLRLRYTSGGAISGATTTVSLSGSGALSPTGSVSSSASDITLTYTAPASSSDGTATITAAAYKGFSALSSTMSYSGITFTLTPATATVDADGQSTAGLTLTFRYTTGGGAISGATATVSATSGSVSPTSPASSASPIAVTYTAPATSSDGTATVAAAYRGFTATSTITLRGITFTLTPASATVDADGQSTAGLTLRLRYTSGGAITGASTTVSLSGQGSLSPTGSVASSASDITLTYTAPVSSSDGTATITAAAYKGFSALTSTITFRGVVLSVSASPTSIAADGVTTSTLTATLTAGGSGLSGRTINFSTTAGSLSAGTAVTNGSGQANVTLTSSASKTNVTATITASYIGSFNNTATVTFTGITINPVGYFAATAGNGQVTLYWENSTGYFTKAVVVRKAGSAPTDPVDGASYSGDGTVVYEGTAATFADAGVTNGTRYYYKVYTAYSSSLLYSTGTLLDATPTAGGPGEAKWSYSSSASGLVEPVTDGGGSIFWNSPAGGVVGTSATDGSPLWSRALAGMQVEGPVVLAGIEVLNWTYALVGGNDGTVAAVDVATGAVLWQTASLGAAIGGSVGMQVWAGSDAAFQGQFSGDVFFVGTKNADPTNNKVYALNATTGAVLWTFNASGATAVDIVTGVPWVNSNANQVLITTRSNGGSQPSLWALSTLDGSLVASWSLGDINSWLGYGMDGVAYVPAADGKLYALDLATLTMKWTSSFDTGAGNPIVDYIWEDWALQGTLFFSTQDGNVWAIQSSGGPTPPTFLWKTAVAGASAPIVFSGDGILYVGGGDGKIHQLRLADGVDEKQQPLGDGTAAVGTPTWDWTTGWLVAGTAAGKVFAIPTPLP